jgi:hypothetical protein
LLLPLISLLSLPLHRRPCLPSQPCCNDRRRHGRCLCRYRCRLPHFVDCCLPPQFLLLSATAIATVAAAATADPVSAAVAAAVCPHCRCHCPCRPCTCPLCCRPASSPSPSPMSPSLLLARHPRCHCSCRRRHHPLCCMTPLSQPCFGRRCHRRPPLPPPPPMQTSSRRSITVNAATAASIFTDVCLCFCHYPHHRFRMCRSHHDCHFCHSHCHFLVDCCLTHHCHCSADAFANGATSQRTFASHSPGWLSRSFSLRNNCLTRHRLLTRRLVVLSTLIAPPSHFPQLVVASPLITPSLLSMCPLPPLNSQRVIASPRVGTSNFLSPFVKNTPPTPSRLFFWTLDASG